MECKYKHHLGINAQHLLATGKWSVEKAINGKPIVCGAADFNFVSMCNIVDSNLLQKRIIHAHDDSTMWPEVKTMEESKSNIEHFLEHGCDKCRVAWDAALDGKIIEY